MAALGDVYRDRLAEAQARLRFAFVVVTPELAMEALADHNGGNRPQNYWKKLAKCLRRAGFLVNGETVVFSDTGRLLNGQNRLRAGVETLTAFPAVVVWGVSDEAFATFDSGKSRTARDVLAIAKFKQTACLAAALAWQQAYEAKEMDKPRPSIPNDEVVAAAMRHPEIVEAVPLVMSKYRKVGYPPALAAFLWRQFSERDAEKAGAFFDRVMRGLGVSEPSWEHNLRRRIDSQRSEENESVRVQRKRSNKVVAIPVIELAAITIKAWNGVRSGESPKRALAWKSVEKFPEIA